MLKTGIPVLSDEIGDFKTPKEPIKGVFQRWGDEIENTDEKTFARTVAIVLGGDGKVYTAPPNAVVLLK